MLFRSKTNGKKRVYYHLTEEGRMHYEAKCREWFEVKELVDKFAAVAGSSEGSIKQ